ncbi:ABC transporter ATP-binding protein [Clostridium pasteurianum]|uniref:ABC-type multidrug transport system, ATPase and permease component n=1 Tax=Clostridium pasteurianum BC1 TaxID=86416 RepID=R4K811_CLOPA|nr:ABC transporter ATP-binding protein [Clostridium pasteurianum]AGK98688.1 ABC-type multidrug transport system, ATPase and permease component [Clostridium pasteurianum BC1]
MSNMFKWIWNYMRKYKFKMFFGVFLIAVCSALNMVTPYLSGKIVDNVIVKRQTNSLMIYLTIIISVTFIRSILRYYFQLIFENVSQNILFTLREQAYEKLQKLDFSFYEKNETGNIMTAMTGDMDTIRHFVAWVIYMVVENGLIFIFSIGIMFTVNYKLAILMILYTPVIGYFTFKLSRKVKPTFSSIRQQFSRLNSVVQENISGNRVVKAFAKEDYEIKKFNKENEAYRERNFESAKVWEKYLPVLDSLSSGLNIVVILIGGIMVINSSLSMGELITFSSLIFAINNPLRMAGWLTNDVERFRASAEKVYELMNTKTKIKNSKNLIKTDKIAGNIEFKNVYFCYENENILSNINIKVKAGETLAIIGPTGSGKSFLLNLLCRFYDCTKGEILIDGIDIKKINLKKLRDSIGVAMQDIFLFSDTVEANIAYGVSNASFEEINKAAQMSIASDFINNLSEGYETIIGERGVGLSGGQKQRISLARALLKNPAILVLDDTTSSVDMETEFKIQNLLSSYIKEKTTIIVSHRISSVKKADKIIVLNKGKIVEQGNHKELLENDGYYYRVYMNQFGDFDGKSNNQVV